MMGHQPLGGGEADVKLEFYEREADDLVQTKRLGSRDGSSESWLDANGLEVQFAGTIATIDEEGVSVDSATVVDPEYEISTTYQGAPATSWVKVKKRIVEINGSTNVQLLSNNIVLIGSSGDILVNSLGTTKVTAPLIELRGPVSGDSNVNAPLSVKNSTILVEQASGEFDRVSRGRFVQTSDIGIFTTGFQSLIGPGIGHKKFGPIDTVGSNVTLKLGGVTSMASNDRFVFQIMGGVSGTSLIYQSPQGLASRDITNEAWDMRIDFTVRAVGGIGSALLNIHGIYMNDTSDDKGGVHIFNGSTNGNLDLTIVNTFDVRINLLDANTQSITTTFCTAQVNY